MCGKSVSFMPTVNRVSNLDVKKLNRNRVFRYINAHERISRPEVAAALGMSAPTVLLITNELLEKGLIYADGELDSTGGRKAKALSSVYGKCYSVGIDITQNHISLVLTDLSGSVLRHLRVYKPFVYDETYLSGLGRQTAEFLEGMNIQNEKILGVGISVPGIINTRNSRIAYSHALNIFDVPFDAFSHSIPYKCLFVNDANAAAIAEQRHIDDADHAVYLMLSNSVGGTIISRQALMFGGGGEAMPYFNNLYVGRNFKSGEIGHMTLVPGGRDCYCGKKGCFDAYCNAKILAGLTNGKLELFFEQLGKGEPKFMSIWNEYLDSLAVQVNTLRMLMDCDVIVGGYVGSYMEPYIDDLRKRLADRSTFGEDGSYLRVCRYKIEASSLGAALLHIEDYVSSV
jgi:predicted NBD/HSP70 family sugar kinase